MMKIKLHVFACITAVLLSAPSLAQSNNGDQCDWWGRDIYPICQNKDTGWGRENGEKCISRDTCVNGQPSDRGGIISGGSSSGGSSSSGGGSSSSSSGGGSNSSSSGGSGNGGDQCNTTAQCQAIYGNQATDCLNSQSNSSVCMCGSSRCDGQGGGSSSGSSSSSSGGGSNVPQPPSSCSNVGQSIPNNIRLHNIFDSNITRPEFSDTSRWYTEDGNVQRFQLHEGDQNQRTAILRPRIEAFSPPPRWKQGSGWHEFSANYYLSEWDEPQLYAIFQIKTNDASNFIIQGLIDRDGSLKFARRSKGRVKIADNVMRTPFHLRVRSNGYRFEVYLNCERVLAEDHPQPQLENSNTQYGWRWGLYRQQADDDRHDGTTTLYVTGPKFN